MKNFCKKEDAEGVMSEQKTPVTLEDLGIDDADNASPNGFICTVSDAEIKREREKARQLRNSQWWKNRRATGICYYCKKKFPPQELTMDHIIPIVRGGKSTKTNIVPCCKECNSKKKYLLPTELGE